MTKRQKVERWCTQNGLESFADFVAAISAASGASYSEVEATLEGICSGERTLKKGFKNDIDGALVDCKISELDGEPLIEILRTHREDSREPVMAQVVLRTSPTVQGTCEVELICPAGSQMFRTHLGGSAKSRPIPGISGEPCVSNAARFLINLAVLGTCPHAISTGRCGDWVKAGFKYWSEIGVIIALKVLTEFGLFVPHDIPQRRTYTWPAHVTFVLKDERS